MGRQEQTRLLAWRPGVDAAVAAAAGIIVLLLSAAMIPVAQAGFVVGIILRDALMVSLVGVLFPLWYVRRRRLAIGALGLTCKRWETLLPVNLGLGIALLLMLLAGRGYRVGELPWLRLGGSALYVMLTGGFEVLFFYAFQRSVFERAFGVLPSLLLTAFFYSLHHIGFQPEFAKLFLVGLLYAGVAWAGRSVLAIYPFFWGVGAVYDVLFQSQAVGVILYPWARSAYLALFWVAVVLWWRWPGSVHHIDDV